MTLEFILEPLHGLHKKITLLLYLSFIFYPDTHLMHQTDAKFPLLASRVQSYPTSMKDFQKNMEHILKTILKEN